MTMQHFDDDYGTFRDGSVEVFDALVVEGAGGVGGVIGVICLDLETTGLEPSRGAWVRVVQLCGEAGTVVLDLGPDEKMARQRWWNIASDLMLCGLVSHNSVFEGGFLWEAGSRGGLGLLHDTMLANACLFTRKGQKQSLAAICERVLDVKLDKDLQKSDWAASELSEEQLEYARRDVEVTWRLWKVLAGELERTGLWEGYELLRGAVPAIIEMQMTGIAFDVKAHGSLCVDLGVRLEKAEAECREWCSEDDVENLNSGPQISGWILKTWPDLGQAWIWSESGRQLSLSAETVSVMIDAGGLDTMLTGFLEAYQGREEVRSLLKSFGPSLGKRVYRAETWRDEVEGRDLDQVVSQARDHCISGPRSRVMSDGLESIQDQDSRLFASFMINGAAATGRMSSSRPNMQNQPARRYPEFRRIFTASPEHQLIIADYAQIEVRVGALLSGQTDLLERMASGSTDLHTIMAADLFKIAIGDVTKGQRGQAKALTFGVQYGMQAKSLSNVLGCSEAEAREFLMRWEETYPMMHAQRAEWKREAGRTKCLMTAGGRRLMCGSKITYQQAANYPVQAGAADVMYAALGEFARLRWDREMNWTNRMLLVVHDELVIESQVRHVDACVQLTKDAMNGGFLRVFPGTLTTGLVDITITSDWSQKG